MYTFCSSIRSSSIIYRFSEISRCSCSLFRVDEARSTTLHSYSTPAALGRWETLYATSSRSFLMEILMEDLLELRLFQERSPLHRLEPCHSSDFKEHTRALSPDKEKRQIPRLIGKPIKNGNCRYHPLMRMNVYEWQIALITSKIRRERISLSNERGR